MEIRRKKGINLIIDIKRMVLVLQGIAIRVDENRIFDDNSLKSNNLAYPLNFNVVVKNDESAEDFYSNP